MRVCVLRSVLLDRAHFCAWRLSDIYLLVSRGVAATSRDTTHNTYIIQARETFVAPPPIQSNQADSLRLLDFSFAIRVGFFLCAYTRFCSIQLLPSLALTNHSSNPIPSIYLSNPIPHTDPHAPAAHTHTQY